MTNDDDGLLRGVRVGAPAHGGHAVARHEGRVVFVRHAAPGELVDVRLTDAAPTARFWRGDAVAVTEGAPERVTSPWPEAGPGGVGGGELAHLSLAGQRAWKERVLREALARFAGMSDDDVAAVAGAGELVTAAPGDAERGGLESRTRIELTVDGAGHPGMYRYRSHDLVPVTRMPLAVPALQEALADLPALAPRGGWAPGTRLDLVAPSGPGEHVSIYADGKPVRGRTRVTERVRVGERDYDVQVEGTGFWQVHPEAPALLARAVLDAADVAAGEAVLELYSGAGLFTLPLADAVGPAGSVTAVEAPGPGARAARRNARNYPQVALVAADVGEFLRAETRAGAVFDVVVLDPPRAGAGRYVVESIAALEPRRVVYVACDPVALARDLATAAAAGLRPTAIRAFDLFPHTHHLETMAVLEPTPEPSQ